MTDEEKFVAGIVDDFHFAFSGLPHDETRRNISIFISEAAKVAILKGRELEREAIAEERFYE